MKDDREFEVNELGEEIHNGDVFESWMVDIDVQCVCTLNADGHGDFPEYDWKSKWKSDMTTINAFDEWNENRV